MVDPEATIPMCPQGGRVSVHTMTPVLPGWVVTCSVHGQLNQGGGFEWAIALVYEHAGVRPPQPPGR